jgi:hypothetical protein
MQSIGITATALTGDELKRNPKLWKEIDAGTYKVLFASPELLLRPGSYFWHKMAANRKKHPFLKKLMAFVIDEAHMIWKWGASGFRIEYKNIGHLRVYFPDTPFILLSATIAPNVRGYLHTSLHLATPTYIMRRSLLRTNIRLLFARARAPVGDYSDLDFLILNSPVAFIPKTMIFVDDKNEAQHIATYMRKRLSDPVEGATAICVYTAAHSTNSRNEFMSLFLAGDCRIIVCTDAAGMGMNIPNIEIVIQYRLTDFMSLTDLWQRIGRCARDQSIEGLGLVFVDDKYILPFEFASEDPNLNKLSVYTLPVKRSSHNEATEVARHIYDKLPGAMGQSAYFKLDPPLLWAVNTFGCRNRAILINFEDSQTFTEFICKCDNCSFPVRQKWDRMLAPTELRIERAKKWRPGERLKEKKRLEQENQRIVKARQDSIEPFRAISSEEFIGFNLSRSLRYEDTAAYNQDLIDKQYEVNLNTPSNSEVPAMIIETVETQLRKMRCTIFIREGLMEYGLTEYILLSEKMVSKIAKRCTAIANRNDLQSAVGSSYDLSNSILEPYIEEIINVIAETTATLSPAPGPQAVLATVQDNTACKRNPVAPRKRRKYEVTPEAEENLIQRGDFEALERQRALKAYDKAIDDRTEKRFTERQLAIAEKAIETKAQKRDLQKQAAASGKTRKQRQIVDK